jgi:hypothetical protein
MGCTTIEGRRSLRFFAATVSVLLVQSMAGAAAPPPRLPPSALPAGDERLQKRVTIERRSIYLGELLAEVSRATGVRLAVEEGRGPVSGIRLIVAANRVPARDLLESLPPLFATPSDRWRWLRVGESGGYVLRHERSPREAAELERGKMWEQFTADLNTTMQIVRLPPGEREAAAARRPDLIPSSGADWARRTLLGQIPDAKLPALLAGEPITVARSHLTAQAAAVYDASLHTRTGVIVPGEPPPTTGIFYLRWPDGELGPVLWAKLGESASNLVGGSLWESNWRKQSRDGWRDYRDRQVRALQVQGSRPAGDPVRHLLADPVGRQDPRADLLALLKHDRPPTLPELALHTEYTWREDTLIPLLRHPSAPTHRRGHLVSWSFIRTLRAAAEARDGYLGLPELGAMHNLTREQLEGLNREFPDASPARYHEIWRGVFRFYSELDAEKRRRLTSSSGLPFSAAGRPARAALLETTPRTPGLSVLQSARNPTVSLRVGRSAAGAPQVEWRVGGQLPSGGTFALTKRNDLEKH